MENRLVAARDQGWTGRNGYSYKEATQESCGTAEYFDCGGGGYIRLHVMKLHRATHPHT